MRLPAPFLNQSGSKHMNVNIWVLLVCGLAAVACAALILGWQ